MKVVMYAALLSRVVGTNMEPLGVAKLGAYPGYSGDLTVQGEVAVAGFGDQLFLSWGMIGVPAACASHQGTEPKNACGIHIHEGTTCDDATQVGGHFYVKETVDDPDPWAPKIYTTYRSGFSAGFFGATTGYNLQDVVGRAMVVHDETGGRVACGLISSTTELTGSRSAPLQVYPGYEGDLKVKGDVGAFIYKDAVHLYFSLFGVEKMCETTPEGVANACGVHIHEGKTCEDAAQVGGHYYDKESIDADPWANVAYISHAGFSTGASQLDIGKQDIGGRAIVVHDSTGARVACAQIPSRTIVV